MTVDSSFTADGLRRRLTVPVRPTICACVDSTNTAARLSAMDGAAAGLAIVADRQTAGRGRRGRSFFSPAGTGLYISLLLRPTDPAAKAASLTAVAAVATAEAIEAVSGQPVGIKWVNDLWRGNRKIAGILTEGAVTPRTGRLDYAVIGVGINLCAPPDGFPPELDGVAGTVFDRPVTGEERCRLATEVLNRLWTRCNAPADATVPEQYRRRSVLTGRTVTVEQGDARYDAAVRGIDDAYRLLLTLPDGRSVALQSGEVSVRLA